MMEYCERLAKILLDASGGDPVYFTYASKAFKAQYRVFTKVGYFRISKEKRANLLMAPITTDFVFLHSRPNDEEKLFLCEHFDEIMAAGLAAADKVLKRNLDRHERLEKCNEVLDEKLRRLEG
jgi:hypothetical protein